MTVLDVVFAIIIVFVVTKIANNVRAQVEEQNGIHPNGIPKCPPHKWTYKDVKIEETNEIQNIMICDKCKRIPNQD